MTSTAFWRHAGVGCVAGITCLGGWLALELPVPQRVQSHLTNIVEEQRARNYKRWRPKRIILLRHGETHGYVHTCKCEIDGVPVCASKPEHDRPLTDKGFEQALLAGNELKALIGEEKTRFLVSPYRACKQTFDCVSVPFDPAKCNFREEPRVRNQDLGKWWERLDAHEIVRKKDEIRREAGSFYFRWPGGESCADVYDRVSLLLESLHKEWERPHADNYVLVSHTVTCQIILMKWFHWDVATFEKLDKFRTGQFVVMERQENGRYKITNEIFTQHSLARTTSLRKDFVGERDLNVTHASLQKWGSEVNVANERHGEDHEMTREDGSLVTEDLQRGSGCDAELAELAQRESVLADQLVHAADGSQQHIADIEREIQAIETDRALLKLRWRRGENS